MWPTLKNVLKLVPEQKWLSSQRAKMNVIFYIARPIIRMQSHYIYRFGILSNNLQIRTLGQYLQTTRRSLQQELIDCLSLLKKPVCPGVLTPDERNRFCKRIISSLTLRQPRTSGVMFNTGVNICVQVESLYTLVSNPGAAS